MDAFKLAFDTTIAGLLALPWLIVAIDLLFPFSFARVTETFKVYFSEHLETVLAIWLVSIAYCLGSAISPIARQFLDDEHLPISEHTIRTTLYCQQIDLSSMIPKSLADKYPSAAEFRVLHGDSFCGPGKSATLTAGQSQQFTATVTAASQADTTKSAAATVTLVPSVAVSVSPQETVDPAKDREQRIAALFGLQESKVLSQGSSETERLRQLTERLIVLRGTVFNGALLWLLLLFSCIAPKCKNSGNRQGDIEPGVTNIEPDAVARSEADDGYRRRTPQPGSGWIKVREYILLSLDRVRRFMRSHRIFGGVAIALCSIVFLTYTGYTDIRAHDITDEPIMECALLIATIIGLWSVLVGAPPRKYLGIRFLVVVTLITLLAYGGWIWTEIIYVQEVISSLSVI